ncbi:hypothetical protein SteCoe_13708 [Stentor coeruleus]|uniref:Tetratricopeptide SHNi-TPR domain-containing protein n=1 Tax=Stentor coeruleus TaxID=5963 RepID=A0A1R2C7R5_9CILI|nr:hypothetical protein SteCoe_13708 [Stentor coeruleus]
MEDLTKKAELPSAIKEREKAPEDVVITEASPQKSQNPEEIYNEGLGCIRNGNLEQAIELLSKALEIATITYGELDSTIYKYYYNYADALILQHEKENEGKIFGEAVPEQVACSVSSSQLAEEGSSNEEGSSSYEDLEENEPKQNENPSEEQAKVRETSSPKEEENSNEEGDDEEEEGSENDSFSPEDNDKNNEPMQLENPPEKTDDLQLAWESLESARVILKNHENLDIDYLIKVITRLGDLLSYKEEFEKACQEYKSALALQITIEGDGPSRTKASLHFLLGNNFIQIKGKELESAENFDKALEYMTFIMENTKNEDERSELVEIIKEIKVKKEDALEQKESLTALQELDVNPNSFDAPQMENVVDLGVIKKKKPGNEEDDMEKKKRFDE